MYSIENSKKNVPTPCFLLVGYRAAEQAAVELGAAGVGRHPQLTALSNPNGQQDLCRVQGNL